MSAENDFATRLWRARTRGGVLLRAAADGLDSVTAAYGVQSRMATLAAMPRAGWKVGATSKAPQKLLGTDGPATAPMFRPFCFESPAEVAVFANQDASVEGEFAFRFARDLPPRPGAYGLDEVLAAVDVLVPAIEIVGCRFEGGFAGLGAIRLVADMTAHTAFVSGPKTAEWPKLDLRSHTMSLYKNGKLVAEGSGANVLDGPLSVLQWTANHLSRLGETICAGEIVTTGTCTGVTPVVPGDTVAADFGNLGHVELQLVAA